MRIRVVQTPSQPVIDGISLDGFRVGVCYEVGTTLGAVFLSEGWAVPASGDEPAVPVAVAELESELDVFRTQRRTYSRARLRTVASAADSQRERRSAPNRHKSDR